MRLDGAWSAVGAMVVLGPACSPPCDDDNCTPCAVSECPTGDMLHRHGDGCPSCFPPGDEDDTELVVPADTPTATEET